MNFINYESINDKLVWFSKDLTLSITVKLGRRDLDGNRKYFQNEYSYPSKYNNCETLISLKRNYDCYFVIDSSIDKEIYIQIRVENMIAVRYTLESIASDWLMNDDIWIIKNKKLMLKGNVKSKDILNLPMGKWLSFTPTPMLDINNQYSKGVRMYLSDYNKFIDIDIDKFMGLLYIFQTFSIHLYAAEQLAYLAADSARGINISQIQNAEISTVNNGYSGPNRTIQQNNKSFFDQ